jgi:hypothetical protein
MKSEQQPTPQYFGYLFLFVFLFFLFYLFPELMLYKRYGFAPVEHLVDSGPHPTLETILASLWAERAQLLNPMNNPLVRFFLVTTIVGVVFDGVRKWAPSK